jgi:hypothetical protein
MLQNRRTAAIAEESLVAHEDIRWTQLSRSHFADETVTGGKAAARGHQ